MAAAADAGTDQSGGGSGGGVAPLRRETMRKLNYSLRDLYRTLEQPADNFLRGAHARLDAAVRAAYSMPDDADPLACAAREKAGERITPPGLPSPPEEHAQFITDDCIRPPTLSV